MSKQKQVLVEKRYGTVQLESYKPAKDKSGPVLGTFVAKGMAVENTVSQNRTYYSSDVWASPLAFGKGGEYIDENGKLKPTTLMGTVDHPSDTGDPDDMIMKLQNAAVVWKDVVRTEDGKYNGTADILNTPHGKIVNTLLEYAKINGGGDIIGVSSRGFGESESTNEGYSKIIPDSYELLAFDVVYNPSFKNSASLLEGKKSNRKSLTEAIKALSKEDAKHADIYKEYASYLENENKQKEVIVEESRINALEKAFVKELKEEIYKLTVSIHNLDVMEKEEFAEQYPNKSYDKLMAALIKEKQNLESYLEKFKELPTEITENNKVGEKMGIKKLTEASDLDEVVEEFAKDIDEFGEPDPDLEDTEEDLGDTEEDLEESDEDLEDTEEEEESDEEEESEEDLIELINKRLDAITEKLDEIIGLFSPVEDFESEDIDEDLEDLELELEEEEEESEEESEENLDLSELSDEELEALISEEEDYLEKNK